MMSFQVAGNDLGGCLFLEVVRADQDDHALGVEGENVSLHADEYAARGVPADAAVGHLDSGEAVAHVVAPTLGDGVAEKYQGSLILLNLLGPVRPLALPEILKPTVSPYGAFARQTFIGGGDGELGRGEREIG